MADSDLSSVEENFVHQVYDAISGHFSATRFAVWPKVRNFIESIPAGAIVADVGCGNGKYFAVRDDWAIIGSDRSKGLAEVSQARILSDASPASSRKALSHADVLVADGLKLPYRPGAFDAAICIAVLHHITSRERRLQMLRQLLLILRPGGRALVTVWATQQEEPHKTIHKWHPLNDPSQAFQVSTTSRSEAKSESAAVDKSTSESAAVDKAASSQHTAVDEVANCLQSASLVGKDASGATPVNTHIQQATAHTAGVPDSGSSHTIDTPEDGDDDTLGTTSLPANVEGHEAKGSSRTGADYLVPWHLPFHRAGGIKVPGEGEAGSSGHVEIDSKKGAVVFKRYYHLFDEGELDELVVALGAGAKLVTSYYDKSNWCVVFERVSEG